MQFKYLLNGIYSFLIVLNLNNLLCCPNIIKLMQLCFPSLTNFTMLFLKNENLILYNIFIYIYSTHNLKWRGGYICYLAT